MQRPDARTGSNVPFARRWYIIDEIDLIGLVADHSAIERLCVRLEACADRLPERPAPDGADELCVALQAQVLDHFHCEERLLTAMFARELRDPLSRALLDAIHSRHVACAVLAQDLIATLEADSAGHRTICAEALGYMLRSFFEGCRAATAFEELAILTLAGTRLTGEARTLLVSRLAPARTRSGRFGLCL